MIRSLALTVIVLVVLALVAGVAEAKVVGFADTFEFVAPPFGQVKDATVAAERGYWEIWNDNIYMEHDPSCTSTKVMVADGTLQVGEVHGVFTHVEKYGISETKVDLGVSRTDVRSGKVSVYAEQSDREIPIFEFLGNDRVEVFGQIQDTVPYQDVFQNDCATGEDRRFTLRWFLNFEDWNMRAVLTSRENGDIVEREYGPVPMDSELAKQGIQKVRFYVPGGAGKFMWDGMVCTDNSLPADNQSGSRHSSWGR